MYQLKTRWFEALITERSADVPDPTTTCPSSNGFFTSGEFEAQPQMENQWQNPHPQTNDNAVFFANKSHDYLWLQN